MNEYPWIGLIQIDERVQCGCSLITDRYVLTAAHCLQGFDTSRFTITFLEHRRSDTNESMRIVTRVFELTDKQKIMRFEITFSI